MVAGVMKYSFRGGVVELVVIPNQSAIFVGSVYGFSMCYLYAFVPFFFAVLISSLI